MVGIWNLLPAMAAVLARVRRHIRPDQRTGVLSSAAARAVAITGRRSLAGMLAMAAAAAAEVRFLRPAAPQARAARVALRFSGKRLMNEIRIYCK